ncbi:unnamed protein product [Closterium sp. NIES-64]|nr:unnamed protein product [Closterium sp. NIES-64]
MPAQPPSPRGPAVTTEPPAPPPAAQPPTMPSRPSRPTYRTARAARHAELPEPPEQPEPPSRPSRRAACAAESPSRSCCRAAEPLSRPSRPVRGVPPPPPALCCLCCCGRPRWFESVGAASAPSGKRRTGKAKGGKGAGGAGRGGGGGGGAVEGVGVVVRVVAGVEVLVAAVEAEAAGRRWRWERRVAEVAEGGGGGGGAGRGGAAQRRGGGTGPCTYVLRTGDRAVMRVTVTGVFRPESSIETAALGVGEATALGASEAATLGAGTSASSGAGESALSVAVSLADPSGGPVLAHFSTVLPCPAAPFGTLFGLYLPSFSTNLVSGADLQDAGVHQFTPASQRVSLCTDTRTGRHLATFIRRPGSSLYTLSAASPPTASGQVAASGQVFAAASRSGPESSPCSCRLLSHETLLWHHRLGHPSLPRLRGMASRVLVSGLPRSLPPLPPGLPLPASLCRGAAACCPSLLPVSSDRGPAADASHGRVGPGPRPWTGSRALLPAGG